VTSYADDAQLDGVETNCLIGIDFPGASGTVQLSWSQPLVSGLRVRGSAGELHLDPGRFESVRWRRHGGEWQTRVSTAAWPTDVEPAGRRATPLTYYDCIYHEVVQALRAVVHGESVPAGGEEGLTAVRAIDACYQRVVPLDHPWLTPVEQADAEQRHWSQQRWAA
jgi:predicted dehydrogenase